MENVFVVYIYIYWLYNHNHKIDISQIYQKYYRRQIIGYCSAVYFIS